MNDLTAKDRDTTNNNKDHPSEGSQCRANPRGEEHDESATAIDENDDQNNQASETTDEESTAADTVGAASTIARDSTVVDDESADAASNMHKENNQAAATDEESAAPAAAVRDASTTNPGLSIDTNGDGSGPFYDTLPPGAYRCVGPGYSGETEEAASGNANEIQNNGGYAMDDVVFEGFVPEPTPEDILRQQAEEMLRSAITLEDSAVRIIDDNREIGNDNVSDVEDSGSNYSSAVGALQGCLKSPLSLFFLTILLLSTIALGVAFGGSGGKISNGFSSVDDQPSQPSLPYIIDVQD